MSCGGPGVTPLPGYSYAAAGSVLEQVGATFELAMTVTGEMSL